MRALVLIFAVVVSVLAGFAYLEVRRRLQARLWAALPARWVVEIVEVAGHNPGAVETAAMLHLTMPDGEIIDRHRVTATLYTAEHPAYVGRVAEMQEQAHGEADDRNRRRRLVQDTSNREGRLVVPHSWTI